MMFVMQNVSRIKPVFTCCLCVSDKAAVYGRVRMPVCVCVCVNAISELCVCVCAICAVGIMIVRGRGAARLVLSMMASSKPCHCEYQAVGTPMCVCVCVRMCVRACVCVSVDAISGVRLCCCRAGWYAHLTSGAKTKPVCVREGEDASGRNDPGTTRPPR